MNKFWFLLATILFSVFLVSAQTITQGPITGGVTQESARVLFFADQSLAAELRYSKQANFNVYDTITASTDPNNGNVLKFTLQDLEGNTQYYHQVFINGNPAADVGTFKTKPCEGEAGNYTFLLGSCQNENRSDDEVFAEMLNHPADFFLQIGDWGYPDDTDNLPNNNDVYSADYSRVINAFKEKYSYSNMREFLKTLWIDYVWDDHDYINDNTSRNSSSYTDFGFPPVLTEIPHPPGARRNIIKGYYEMFPGFEPVDSTEGIYHKFRYGNIEVFMLDDRAARDPATVAIKNVNGDYVFDPPPGHTIIGLEQREWLLENLKKSTATWKFITTATAFNKSYRDAIQGVLNLPSLAGLPLAAALVDSWSGYPMDQDSIINMINREKIDGVIMMSGDTHTTGIDDGQAGGLPEIMAGCLSQTNSALFTTAPLLVYGLTWSEGGQGINGNTNTNDSFGKVSIDGDNSVTLEIIDENGTLIADHTIYSCSYYTGLDLQVSNSQDAKCYGANNGTVEVQATGGTPPYQYTIDRDNYQFSPVFSGLAKGRYTVAVKDLTGCTNEVCVYIEQPDSIKLEVVTTPVQCNGNADGQAEIFASGGTGNFSYLWTNRVNSTPIDTNLSARGYQVLVRDSNLCSKRINFSISEPPAINYSSIIEDVPCYGGSDGIATIVASGGVDPVSIEWNDGRTTFTNNQLSYGYQSFTLTDSNACTFTDSVFLDQADSLFINPIITADSGGREGSIILNPQGGTKPYLYQWQGPSRSDTLRNLSTGDYTLNLIDANGCILKTELTVPFDSTTQVGIENILAERHLTIYPNPVQSNLQIDWSGKNEIEQVEIYNISGKTIWQENTNISTSLKVNVSQWPAGVYFVKIKADNKSVVKRFVIKR